MRDLREPQCVFCPGCDLRIFEGQDVVGVEHANPLQMLWHTMCRQNFERGPGYDHNARAQEMFDHLRAAMKLLWTLYSKIPTANSEIDDAREELHSAIDYLAGEWDPSVMTLCLDCHASSPRMSIYRRCKLHARPEDFE